VAGLFSAQTPAVLLENDGIIVTGPNLMQAFDRFEVAEFVARTQLSAPCQQDLLPLNDERIQELDQYYH
jgi:L-fuculose-phosphate aldolase